MGAGLQVWDANGKLIFDTPDRMGRIVGSVATTTGGSGSITFAVPAGCTPFWFTSAPPGINGVPRVRVSGTTISWSGGEASTIFYGYF